eukprot:1779318-Ditylum_brightwellii.AAC.1
MKNEISYCSRKLLVNFDNNAASCYDRTMPNLVNLIGRQKGLQRNIMFVHASTLAEAKFKLKTALGTNDFYNENATPEELICLMQEDAQFLQDGTPVVQSTRPGPALVVKQSNNKTVTEIQNKNPYTPHATLGHLKTPVGENISQKSLLQRKSEGYAVKASISSLTHQEAKMYYNSCYIKSVGYVLGQCFFTQDKLEDIEKDAIRVFTSQMGYNRNMAKVIRNGPETITGVSVTRLINVQGSEQVKKILCHMWSSSQAQKLLVIAWSWAQHQCG